MRSIFVMLLAAIVVFPLTAYATDVEGDVWSTWTKENSPYNVIGEVRVPPESTLVIEPGVLVDFQGHYKFIVDSLATLLAVGTETDSIFFTCDTLTNPDRWHGIRFIYANPSCHISYCRLESGKATGSWPDPDANGGAIYCYYSSPTISHNTISGNSAEYGGGGIYCEPGSRSMISNNTITGNSAKYSGGGIYCSDSRPTISNNTISRNSAESRGGGGIYCEYGSNPMISNNTITENSAEHRGGGIYCYYLSSPSISNNSISGNSVVLEGGGIHCNYYSSPTINNNSISDNSATGEYGMGGGIYCYYYSSPTITNTILWGDTAANGPEIYVESGNPTVTYCDVQGGWPGQGNIDIDPLFRDPENGDFHLMADYCGDPDNSPCIDVGHPDSLDVQLDCFHGLGTDRADMGAYGGRNSGWPTGIEDGEDGLFIPKQFLLRQNYPNPFNATTVIEYQLPARNYVKMEICNILGQRVITLVDERQQAGYRSIIWNASKLSSGLYFYKLTAGDFTETRRMMLVK